MELARALPFPITARQALCAAACAAISLPCALADPIAIGGEIYELPAPRDYARIDGLNTEFDANYRSAIPAYYSLLGLFWPPEDRSRVLAGEAPRSPRFFHCQYDRTLATSPMSSDDFADLVTTMDSEMDMVAEQIRNRVADMGSDLSDALSEKFEREIALEFGGVQPLGGYERGADYYSFGMLLQSDMQGAGAEAGDQKRTDYIATSIVHLGPHVINLYCTTPYSGVEDQTWARDSLSAWRDALLKANPKARDKRPGGTPRLALIGIAAFLALALIGLLFTKAQKGDGSPLG